MEPEKRVYMNHLMQILDLSFEAAGKSYNQTGYWGLIKIAFSLEKLLDSKLIPICGRAPRFITDLKKNNLDSRLSWTLETSGAKLIFKNSKKEEDGLKLKRKY